MRGLVAASEQNFRGRPIPPCSIGLPHVSHFRLSLTVLADFSCSFFRRRLRGGCPGAVLKKRPAALGRALETALGVCYMRPFKSGSMALPPEYVPTTSPDVDRHDQLETLRDQVYAHNDQRGLRETSPMVIEVDNESDLEVV